MRLALSRVLLPPLLVIAASHARADIALAPLFGDHGVLQRDQPVPVWGSGAPGEAVTVSYRGQTARTIAGKDGRWSVLLEPMPAAADPATLVAAGRNTVMLSDVVIGEVWLASGQSNMEWPLERARGGADEVAASNLPLIRELKIERSISTTPARLAKTGGWRPASPRTAGGFSAVGYFFAREVHRRLGVPVGIIHSSYGGTQIESWIGDDARNSTSLAAVLAARWKQAMSEWPPERVARYPADMERWQKEQAIADAAKTKNPLPWPAPPATDDSPALPGGLFNGMIAPLAPFAIRGFLWYQGESNVGRDAEYPELFRTLIQSWRRQWGGGDLPFNFVQLPNYADNAPQGTAWARMREAQASALALPATGMAVAIDVGEADNLHPTDKREVGRRLALLAIARTYGRDGEDSGPQFERAIPSGETIRVQFLHAGSGLIVRGKGVRSLELAGPDKVFHPAEGRIDGDILIVSSPNITRPIAVRYAWSNAPEANLGNGAGLPAAPFRSDNW